MAGMFEEGAGVAELQGCQERYETEELVNHTQDFQTSLVHNTNITSSNPKDLENIVLQNIADFVPQMHHRRCQVEDCGEKFEACVIVLNVLSCNLFTRRESCKLCGRKRITPEVLRAAQGASACRCSPPQCSLPVVKRLHETGAGELLSTGAESQQGVVCSSLIAENAFLFIAQITFHGRAAADPRLL
eukprot:765449-Hanusia_phi.AAC.1